MNKRRFRKSLAQNAIYMKYKRVIPIQSAAGNVLFTANFNGAENENGPRNVLGHYAFAPTSSLTGYTVMTDLPSLATTFDQNRCAAVKVKFFPSIPNGAITAGYQPAYLMRDRDGIDVDWATVGSNPLILQEQINGVKTLNMYRPFKAYMKAPKHRINSRIPTSDPAYASAAQGYSPNVNLAGQWKRVNSSLSQAYDTNTNELINRGSQMAIFFTRPAGLTGEFTLGNLEVTTYYVYKDRT